MTALLAAGLVGAAVLVVPDARGAARRRLTRLAARSAGGSGRARAVRVPWWPPAIAAALALLSGHPGLAVFLGVLTVALAWPGHRDRQTRVASEAATVRDLPRAADLLAACLEAGATVPDALAAVCDAVGGPVAARLRPVAAALRSGLDPLAGPWTRSPSGAIYGVGTDPTDRLIRALARATETGAPISAVIAEISADERERARWAATERARRAGIAAVGPLAACFLPAFVLVGVVPMVAGIASAVLGELS